jgi:hypothetical protein
VVLREAGPGGQRRDPDRRGHPFGELDGQILGTVVVDAGPDDQGRPPGAAQGVRDLPQGLRRGGEVGADVAGRDQGCRSVPVVLRHGQEHRPARRCHRHPVRLGHRGRHVLGALRLGAPFDVRVREGGRLVRRQERSRGQHLPGLLARDEHQGHPVAEGVEDRAQRVAHAARGVQARHGCASAADGVPGRHRDHHGFLQPQHVREVGRPVAQHPQLGGAGIAEHGVDPGPAEEVEDGNANGDRVHGCSSVIGRRRWPGGAGAAPVVRPPAAAC